MQIFKHKNREQFYIVDGGKLYMTHDIASGKRVRSCMEPKDLYNLVREHGLYEPMNFKAAIAVASKAKIRDVALSLALLAMCAAIIVM